MNDSMIQIILWSSLDLKRMPINKREKENNKTVLKISNETQKKILTQQQKHREKMCGKQK